MQYSGEETSPDFNKEYADILDAIAAHNYSKFSRWYMLNQNSINIVGQDADGYSLMYYAVQSLPKERNEDAINIIKFLVKAYKRKGVDPMFLGSSSAHDLISMSEGNPTLKQLRIEGLFRKEGGRRRKSKRSKRKARKTRRR